MFIGHFAIALATKRVAPAVSLGILFFSCQLADLLWPALVLLGIEVVAVDPGNTAFTPLNFVSYPYSHSLLGLTLWSVIAGVLYSAVARKPWTIGAAVCAVGISHWFLDLITHRRDLPLTFSGTARLGWGLWNSVPATIAIEVGLFLAAAIVYARSTIARDRIGSFGFWTLLAFLLLVYLGNAFGPPPPGPTAVAVAAQSMWLLVAWAFWIDRHRTNPNG